MKKVSDSDQIIITALGSVSTKELTTLAKIGTYTTRLADKELIRSALIACWPRLPNDDVLNISNILVKRYKTFFYLRSSTVCAQQGKNCLTEIPADFCSGSVLKVPGTYCNA